MFVCIEEPWVIGCCIPQSADCDNQQSDIPFLQKVAKDISYLNDTAQHFKAAII